MVADEEERAGDRVGGRAPGIDFYRHIVVVDVAVVGDARRGESSRGIRRLHRQFEIASSFFLVARADNRSQVGHDWQE